MKRAAAVVIGLLLAALPFLLYGSKSHEHPPHADHAPRHGGSLFMLGDHHVERVRSARNVELFLSDARRMPLRPSSAHARFGDGRELPLRWQDQRMRMALPSGPPARSFHLVAPDGTELVLPAS